MWNDLRQVDLINYSDLYDKDPELVFPNPVISFYIQLLVIFLWVIMFYFFGHW